MRLSETTWFVDKDHKAVVLEAGSDINVAYVGETDGNYTGVISHHGICLATQNERTVKLLMAAVYDTWVNG